MEDRKDVILGMQVLAEMIPRIKTLTADLLAWHNTSASRGYNLMETYTALKIHVGLLAIQLQKEDTKGEFQWLDATIERFIKTDGGIEK